MKFWHHAGSYKTGKQPGPEWQEISPVQYVAAVHPNLYVYDVETFPNAFTCTIHRPSDGAVWRFEISGRRNQGVEFLQLLTAIRNSGGRMVGFNNVGFDYPIVHVLIERGGHVTAYDLYTKCQEIIDGDDRWGHIIRQPYVEQIDLYKIHHFDNQARSTSLKMLEFNMKSDSIQDLPFPPGTTLTDEQIDVLIKYNDKDVFETTDFLYETLPMIEFRDELSAKYGRDFTNHNDTKIGKDYFIMRLEEAGIPCYEGRKPRQTVRPSIDLNQVVFPWIRFSNPEFQRITDWLRAQTITETKGVFKDVSCTVNGFRYDFGTGGIHGSIESAVVRSDDEYVLADWDVASYYPNLAISNGLFPAHLGSEFCDIYRDVYEQRKGYPKGSAENAMLKLALNGVYGDSNSKYSPFYDPFYTMSITINGQLLLCLLAEYMTTIPGLTMVQINTDGLTVRCPRQHINSMQFIASAWEQLTGLVLERVDYSRMMIRDVNSYIAEKMDGSLKRKGAYCYGSDLGWHQNHSAQIVAIAAEAALVRSIPVERTIRNHRDHWDFYLRTKVPRSSRLEWGNQQLQNITRYYVSNQGHGLTKVMPPTPKQVAANPAAPDRRISIQAGWLVTPCNDGQLDWGSVNYEWYISEANKLVEVLG